jgi:A/G-specific adenine glycosylase
MWSELLEWYQKNKRDLPWRNTQNPYFIWLSEIILQQTRVEQGLPYYFRFIENYPTVNHLAKTHEDAVMKNWQGLGYYSRAINMHQTAKIIVNQYKGVFPNNYNDLVVLKGIGPYTAAAIASFAFNEPKAVLDGNVFRVLSRLYNIENAINTTEGKKIFTQLANEALNKKYPAIHNQAMMELGALICKPSNPNCNECPLRHHCLSLNLGTQHTLPKKIPKALPKVKHLNFIVIIDKGQTYVHQRDHTSIWKNLYEPLCIESEFPLNEEDLMEKLLSHMNIGKSMPVKVYETKHLLTHIKIFGHFWIVNQPIKIHSSIYLQKVAIKDLHNLAIHRLFDKFLNSYKLHEVCH